MQTHPQNTQISSPQSQMLRPIIPAPVSTFSPTVPISPAISPHVAPSPHNTNGPQMGVLTLPPFKTPPVSPFSNPMSNERSVQSVFKLPPPLQAPLPPIQIQPQPQQGIVPSPPISQRDSNSLTETTRYERILPKQSTMGQTSVFSVPQAPAPNGVTSTVSSRPPMLHQTSNIHPHTSHHSTSGQLSGGIQHLTTADQREIARKVSHSAIERRRRERINDKIMQLKELIPSCADQDHLHKLNILQSAIEYIEYLQGLIAESRRRERGNGGDDDREYGRVRKRSKFDRYEILPLSSSSKSRRGYQSRADDSDGYRSKRDSITSISSGSSDTPERRNSEQQSFDVSNTATSPISSPIPENDNVLLLLSAAEVSEKNNQKGKGAEKLTMHDTGTQVSALDLDDLDLDWPMKAQSPGKGEGGKQDDDGEDEGGEGSKVPRRGMTVQNLLS